MTNITKALETIKKFLAEAEQEEKQRMCSNYFHYGDQLPCNCGRKDTPHQNEQGLFLPTEEVKQ